MTSNATPLAGVKVKRKSDSRGTAVLLLAVCKVDPNILHIDKWRRL